MSKQWTKCSVGVCCFIFKQIFILISFVWSSRQKVHWHFHWAMYNPYNKKSFWNVSESSGAGIPNSHWEGWILSNNLKFWYAMAVLMLENFSGRYTFIQWCWTWIAQDNNVYACWPCLNICDCFLFFKFKIMFRNCLKDWYLVEIKTALMTILTILQTGLFCSSAWNWSSVAVCFTSTSITES